MVYVKIHKRRFWRNMDVGVTLKDPVIKLKHDDIFTFIRDAPEYMLKNVGFISRKEAHHIVSRPPFFMRKEFRGQNKVKKSAEEMKELLQEKALRYECKRCKQVGKWQGDVCCCHLNSTCRACTMNWRSVRVYGRPAQNICELRKVKEAVPKIKVNS